MIRLICSKVNTKTRLVGTKCSIISNVVSLLYPHLINAMSCSCPPPSCSFSNAQHKLFLDVVNWMEATDIPSVA
jgi:hypothetical protein